MLRLKPPLRRLLHRARLRLLRNRASRPVRAMSRREYPRERLPRQILRVRARVNLLLARRRRLSKAAPSPLIPSQRARVRILNRMNGRRFRNLIAGQPKATVQPCGGESRSSRCPMMTCPVTVSREQRERQRRQPSLVNLRRKTIRARFSRCPPSLTRAGPSRAHSHSSG